LNRAERRAQAFGGLLVIEDERKLQEAFVLLNAPLRIEADRQALECGLPRGLEHGAPVEVACGIGNRDPLDAGRLVLRVDPGDEPGTGNPIGQRGSEVRKAAVCPVAVRERSELHVTLLEAAIDVDASLRSEEHTSELQSRENLVC